MNESLKQQLESALVFEDDDSKHNLSKVHCVIQAIYKLSFNYYLKQNGLSLKDLDDQNQLAEFRKLTAWPSQSKFVFSLQQMREAYAKLAKNSLASSLMSNHQHEQATKGNKPKNEFWSLLGEAPTVEQSFHILENDKNTSKQELQRIRLLSYAFRLALFQTKITQFRETGNFLALLDSANKELAAEAFRNCIGIVPFEHDFLQNIDVGQQEEEEEEEEEEEREGEKKGKCSVAALQLILQNALAAIEELTNIRKQTTALVQIVERLLQRNEDFCNDDENLFEERDFLHESTLDLI